MAPTRARQAPTVPTRVRQAPTVPTRTRRVPPEPSDPTLTRPGPTRAWASPRESPGRMRRTPLPAGSRTRSKPPHTHRERPSSGMRARRPAASPRAGSRERPRTAALAWWPPPHRSDSRASASPGPRPLLAARRRSRRRRVRPSAMAGTHRNPSRAVRILPREGRPSPQLHRTGRPDRSPGLCAQPGSRRRRHRGADSRRRSPPRSWAPVRGPVAHTASSPARKPVGRRGLAARATSPAAALRRPPHPAHGDPL